MILIWFAWSVSIRCSVLCTQTVPLKLIWSELLFAHSSLFAIHCSSFMANYQLNANSIPSNFNSKAWSKPFAIVWPKVSILFRFDFFCLVLLLFDVWVQILLSVFCVWSLTNSPFNWSGKWHFALLYLEVVLLCPSSSHWVPVVTAITLNAKCLYRVCLASMLHWFLIVCAVHPIALASLPRRIVFIFVLESKCKSWTSFLHHQEGERDHRNCSTFHCRILFKFSGKSYVPLCTISHPHVVHFVTVGVVTRESVTMLDR